MENASPRVEKCRRRGEREREIEREREREREREAEKCRMARAIVSGQSRDARSFGQWVPAGLCVRVSAVIS
jgi:hypothetical protein